jgi:hypothetical protein
VGLYGLNQSSRSGWFNLISVFTVFFTRVKIKLIFSQSFRQNYAWRQPIKTYLGKQSKTFRDKRKLSYKRIARFFLMQYTKNVETVTNCHNTY